MIKGVKLHKHNTSQCATAGANVGGTAIPIYTVPSGKTFILTDIVCDWTAQDNQTVGDSLPGVALLDSTHAGGTVGTYTTAKIMFKQPMYTTTGTGAVTSLVVTGLENGPEFTNEIVALNLSTQLTIPAYGCQIGGYLV